MQNSVTDLAVEAWPIERVRPYEGNPRIIPEAAIKKVAASIETYGWRQPLVVDKEGVLVVGHARLLAAKRLGLTHVPVHVAADLTPEQARAYRLADNRTGEESRWNPDALKFELSSLGEIGFDLTLTGFDLPEMTFLERPVRDSKAPKGIGKRAVSTVAIGEISRGEVWRLGEHRLLCGDSTDAADVARLLDEERPTLMVTDPPYGVDYDPSWRVRAGQSKTTRTGKVSNDDRVDWREAWALFPGDVAYVWHAGVHTHTVAESLLAASFELRAQIIWAKPHFALSRGDYHWQHEPCWYAVRRGAKARWSGGRDQSTLWHLGGVGAPDSTTSHGTQKPVEAMKRPILNNSRQGDAIYEPFAGSGTTFIAAEMSGRRCFGMELDPKYCAAVILRWQEFTGRFAERD
ncbi:DNA modification methylase [Methylosinus sp. LW4]|uniref:DNA modification methylase n=1 Tax=Methylosinus sp. LW4 TaxID=136993 RepID=UPI0003A32D88|nr:DNA methyltransferase [Methylosinus sp. LW4]